MSITFLITTYNRQESCQRLVDSLQGLGNIIVIHDGTDYEITGAKNIKLTRHLGKRGYWQLINILYKNRGNSKFYLMLPDDFLMCDFQIKRAIELWEGIIDTRKICLSIAEGRPNHTCWTKFVAQDRGNVWLSQWVDMCFLCEERFFKELGTIRRIYPRIKGSSGVGAYLSRHLHRKKFNMYQVKESLVTIQPEHAKSQMHHG